MAKRLLENRERFIAVEKATGVPAIWLMPVWEREDPRFDRYFGNGDPLDRKTTDVPAGRGPFATWEEGVDDALRLDHVVAYFKNASECSWEFACYHWEAWNGFGPREHGRASGYLWSGSDQYGGGKYVADRVWSRGTWDRQLGCVVLAKAIAALDPQIGSGLQSAPPAPKLQGTITA